MRSAVAGPPRAPGSTCCEGGAARACRQVAAPLGLPAPFLVEIAQTWDSLHCVLFVLLCNLCTFVKYVHARSVHKRSSAVSVSGSPQYAGGEPRPNISGVCAARANQSVPANLVLRPCLAEAYLNLQKCRQRCICFTRGDAWTPTARAPPLRPHTEAHIIHAPSPLLSAVLLLLQLWSGMAQANPATSHHQAPTALAAGSRKSV